MSDAINTPTPAAKKLDVSISEDNVKKTVAEFLAKNADKVASVTGGNGWSQQVSAWCLAAVMSEVLGFDGESEVVISRNDIARFLQQESLHGLAGNASQFKQWYFGKNEAKKKSIDVDDLA